MNTQTLIRTETPRIYVASLSDYNAGFLHGAWIDADQDADDIYTEIEAMLEQSIEPNAEEFAIHDFDNFKGYEVAEYENIEAVSEIAQLIAEHGEAFSAWLAYTGADIDWETGQKFEEAYIGKYDSEKDFAMEWLEAEYNALPESTLKTHIDWDGAARDLFIDSFYSERSSDYRVHVFARI